MLDAPQIALQNSPDVTGYSCRFVRFARVAIHAEAYRAAYVTWDPSAATGELQRLHREFVTLPPRHDCSCYGNHCVECARIQKSVQVLGTVVEIGRSSPVNAPMPSVLQLDLERAISVLGARRATPERIARYLSEGL